MSSAKPFAHKRRRFTVKAEQILQGAAQVLLQRGYKGVSMDAVAAAAEAGLEASVPPHGFLELLQ
jgi:AcrR family transcriptional regulator